MIGFFEELFVSCFIFIGYGNDDIIIVSGILMLNNDLIIIYDIDIDYIFVMDGEYEKVVIE